MIRAAFLGNDEWSVPTLRALAIADDIEVGLVVTNPPKPAGRGSRLTPTAVAEAARELGVPLAEVEGVRSGDGFSALERLGPDALVVVAYWQILSPEVLAIPRLGAVNVHFSSLPRWRGAAPVQRAILEGDETTGVTIMSMDEGMDTGPILATIEVPIGEDEDAGTLGARLAELGAPLLVQTVRGLEAGTVEARPQDAAGATYAPKLGPEERVIDWTESAGRIVRRVRAFAPDPGATTIFRDEPLKVLRATAIGAVFTSLSTDPGSISVDDDGSVTVHAGGGLWVRLEEIAPAGRKRMSGAEWARGARIRPDERLG